MNLKSDERGFVLVEFVIALPLLILLLYALGMVTVNAAKVAREQVADYVLETEAQYVIDRIAADARAAYLVEINSRTKDFDEIVFIFHANQNNSNTDFFNDYLSLSRYTVYRPNGGRYCVYRKRKRRELFETLRNPITGENSYGLTFVKQLKFTQEGKILHVTLEMGNIVNQKFQREVRFSTSIFMPAYGEL